MGTKRFVTVTEMQCFIRESNRNTKKFVNYAQHVRVNTDRCTVDELPQVTLTGTCDILRKEGARSALFIISELSCSMYCLCRSQWPRGLRRRSAAARLLRSWVRILAGGHRRVCCECCVLSGRGLCDELITRPEKNYQLWCVVVCDLETSRMRRP